MSCVFVEVTDNMLQRSTTCLVLRRRAHLMDQFDRVFNGFVKYFPFALFETVFGVPLCAIDKQSPSAIVHTHGENKLFINHLRITI